LYQYKDKLAIEDPKLSPYGQATQQVLMRMILWKKINMYKVQI